MDNERQLHQQDCYQTGKKADRENLPQAAIIGKNKPRTPYNSQKYNIEHRLPSMIIVPAVLALYPLA